MTVESSIRPADKPITPASDARETDPALRLIFNKWNQVTADDRVKVAVRVCWLAARCPKCGGKKFGTHRTCGSIRYGYCRKCGAGVKVAIFPKRGK